jgi:hypothetical protein
MACLSEMWGELLHNNLLDKMRSSVSIGVFLSHNSNDKPFVRKLASDLESHGVRCWIDEAEIKIGDSLVQKIREGIDSVDYVAVVLSNNSINSPWVQKEIDVSINKEILGGDIKVLPVLLEHCEMPGFLLGKFYADFTSEDKYPESLGRLIKSIGLVFDRTVLNDTHPGGTLLNAINRAESLGLQIYATPFHRPFQYIGMQRDEIAQKFKITVNEGGNLVIDDDNCHMVLWCEGIFITFVDVDLKKTAPQYQNIEFDSLPALGCLSINPSELELVRKSVHCHTYYDHKKKLKITVMCQYDGAALNVGFGTKYYGE